jgi:hypothetical protein
MSCRDYYIDLMSAVPRTAADLLQRTSRQLWAKSGNLAAACSLPRAGHEDRVSDADGAQVSIRVFKGVAGRDGLPRQAGQNVDQKATARSRLGSG